MIKKILYGIGLSLSASILVYFLLIDPSDNTSIKETSKKPEPKNIKTIKIPDIKDIDVYYITINDTIKILLTKNNTETHITQLK